MNIAVNGCLQGRQFCFSHKNNVERSFESFRNLIQKYIDTQSTDTITQVNAKTTNGIFFGELGKTVPADKYIIVLGKDVFEKTESLDAANKEAKMIGIRVDNIQDLIKILEKLVISA